MILDYAGKPSEITRVFECGQGRQKNECQTNVTREGLDLPLLKEATNQGMQAAFRSSKRQENRSSPRVFRKECSSAAPLFWPS